MEQKKELHIFDLDDDCLAHIFSYLNNYHELYKVHKRFYGLIDMTMIENKSYELVLEGQKKVDEEEEDDEEEKEKVKQAKEEAKTSQIMGFQKFLSIFGGKISKLKVQNLSKQQMTIAENLISKYCATAMLMSLSVTVAI